MNVDKKQMRAKAKEIRAQLHSVEKDEKIQAVFFSSPLVNARSFFVYASFQSEVDTTGIIARLLQRKKQVCVPRTLGDGVMLAVPHSEDTEKDKYGIVQPKSGEDTQCDVALVPLLSADKKGNRLGYGGGYYDRYLSSRPNALRVGVCYFGQIVESLVGESWDEPMDMLLTEEGLIPINHAKIKAFYSENLT